MSKDDIDAVICVNLIWSCLPCEKNRKRSMVTVSSVEAEEASISDVYSCIKYSRKMYKKGLGEL